jgi:phosphotransacetylase
MEQTIILDGEKMNVGKLFEEKQKSVIAMAKEVAEREFEILELNFMISSQITNQHSKKTDEYIRNLREKVRNKKVDLEEANQYVGCLN